MASCSPSSQHDSLPDVKAPVAKITPYELVSKFGDKRTDNYYWLKNREDTAVINYLKAENHYRDTMMASVRSFQDSLFDELRSRVKEDDSSVPYKLDNYYYYTRFVEGGEYPIYCRKKDSLEGQEEIIADGNAMGKNQSFLNFFLSTSPDHKLAAIVMDTVGRNFYTIKIKRLADGKFLGETADRPGHRRRGDVADRIQRLPQVDKYRACVLPLRFGPVGDRSHSGDWLAD